LLFLKRVWKEIYPGQDAIADAVFLYPQVRGTTNFVMNGVLPYIIGYLCKACGLEVFGMPPKTT
jgi:hypothetical protein